MRALEKSLFFGSSRNISLEFDGFQKQLIDGGTVIDAQGMPLTEAILENASQVVGQNFGSITDCFLSTLAIANLAKTFFPKERQQLPAPEKGIVGVPITHFNSQNGVYMFNPDVFIKEGTVPLATANTGAPATTGLAIASAAASGSGYKLALATYDWKVSAINQNGETLAVGGSISQAATAGQRVALTITLPTATPTTDQPAASAFKIYRSSTIGAGITVWKYMKTVVAADDPGYVVGNATFAVYDDGTYVEGTSMAFFFDMNPIQVMAFKQLAPIMKLPLATISAAIRFMILLYGVPVLYAPKKGAIVINVGNNATAMNV